MARLPFRYKIASALLGSRAKEFIPALNPFDGVNFGNSGRLNDYQNKADQLSANIGWSFAANQAIVIPTSAVEIKLYRKKTKDKDREEIEEDPLLDLLDSPNLAHTGEQLRQLHFTYMDFVGESYIQMISGGEPFVPVKGKLPDALRIFPAHKVKFVLGETYTKSVVKYGNESYDISSFIRDLNPDPDNIYSGQSRIKAAALTIDLDDKMKEWNRGVFNNGARPSMVFTTNNKDGRPMSDEAYARWKEQFNDEHTGTDNAYKPLLIENGDVKPLMMSQQDLDFLASRKFSRDEILAMWNVNPYMLGSVENVNKATADVARVQHAEINVVPRIRQFIRQINATLVSVYDPTLELDFVNPTPEDIEAKLAEAKASVDSWRTKDEVRAMWGDEALPDGLGEHIIVAGKGGAQTLEGVINGAPAAPTDGKKPADGEKPADDQEGNEPENNDTDNKALAGVKKKT